MTASGYTPKTCVECATSFTPKRHDQIFCSRACLDADRNRALVRGRNLYRELYHMALHSGAKDRGKMLSAVSREARRWIAEDKEAGRNPPPEPEWRRIEKANASYAERRKMMVEALDERNGL